MTNPDWQGQGQIVDLGVDLGVDLLEDLGAELNKSTMKQRFLC